jgi:hypothetical protein
MTLSDGKRIKESPPLIAFRELIIALEPDKEWP